MKCDLTKKENKKLVVHSTAPGFTKTKYGSFMKRVSFDNVVIAETGKPLDESNPVHLFNFANIGAISVGRISELILDLSLVCSVPNEKVVFVIIDVDGNGDPENHVESIINGIDIIRGNTGCEIEYVITPEEKCDNSVQHLFDHISRCFDVPIKYYGYYTSDTTWVNDFFNRLLKDNGSAGNDDINGSVTTIPPMCMDPEVLPKLIPGYIYAFWYGNMNAALVGRQNINNALTAGGTTSGESNVANAYVVVKHDNAVHVHVWILPSVHDDCVDYEMYEKIYVDVLTEPTKNLVNFSADIVVPFCTEDISMATKEDIKQAMLTMVAINKMQLEYTGFNPVESEITPVFKPIYYISSN